MKSSIENYLNKICKLNKDESLTFCITWSTILAITAFIFTLIISFPIIFVLLIIILFSPYVFLMLCKKYWKGKSKMKCYNVVCVDSNNNSYDVGIMSIKPELEIMLDAERNLLEGRHIKTTAVSISEVDAI